MQICKYYKHPNPRSNCHIFSIKQADDILDVNTEVDSVVIQKGAEFGEAIAVIVEQAVGKSRGACVGAIFGADFTWFLKALTACCLGMCVFVEVFFQKVKRVLKRLVVGVSNFLVWVLKQNLKRLLNRVFSGCLHILRCIRS